METKKLNLFIVDDDKPMVTALKKYLDDTFGATIKISTFYDGESCLKNLTDQTHIVVLDYFLNGKNGIEVLKEIKNISPKTEVIMFTSNEDIATAIKAFRTGAKDYIVKGKDSWQKLMSLINNIIAKPIKNWVREFGVAKFILLFFLTFFIMGTAVVWILKLLSH